jgi:general secretion pathway protein G
MKTIQNLGTNRPRRRTTGFSLMELMLVLAIMGILMAVVAVNIMGVGDRAKIKTTKESLMTIKNALQTYHLEQSAYPPDLRTLTTMKPPLLDGAHLQDSWKTDFIYDPHGPSEDQPFVLGSAGKNKVAGDEDDINVWTMDVQN